ncbi:hypothetical protein GIB67_021083 [Kingdonia uniflora]|uniref:AP-5 complex subunit zeta-1 ARM repeats domain-containing protein n=1 Tax=Kingdonia uniflora TaxID=39325 RepID=A0A7J7N7D2_9MAGN|nr:hypothetical protein GIB67_021083 [Kingdonia uniflora]
MEKQQLRIERDKDWEFHLRSLSVNSRDSSTADDPASDPSLLHSVRKLYEMCKEAEQSEDLVARVYPQFNKIFQRSVASLSQSRTSNGLLLLAILQFFLDFGEAVLHDADPSLRTFFRTCLSREFADPVVAEASLEFMDMNKAKLLSSFPTLLPQFPCVYLIMDFSYPNSHHEFAVLPVTVKADCMEWREVREIISEDFPGNDVSWVISPTLPVTCRLTNLGGRLEELFGTLPRLLLDGSYGRRGMIHFNDMMKTVEAIILDIHAMILYWSSSSTVMKEEFHLDLHRYAQDLLTHHVSKILVVALEKVERSSGSLIGSSIASIQKSTAPEMLLAFMDEAYAGGGDLEAEDNDNIDVADSVFLELLKDENDGLSERHWTSPGMTAALQTAINTSQSERLREALHMEPRFLDMYFSIALRDVNKSLLCALIPLLMSRNSTLFPDKGFSYEVSVSNTSTFLLYLFTACNFLKVREPFILI